MNEQKPARNHFTDGGAAYARHRPDYPSGVVDWLAEQCAATLHALDVGCGTGQLSRLLATRFDRVTATDPSASQIESATAHPQVTFKVEAAETIGLPESSIDLITAAQAAHWFELAPFYEECRRVLKPGGILALVSYGVPSLPGGLGTLFDEFYWGKFHAHWPEGRSHVEQGYKTLDFPFEELPQPDMEIVRDWHLDDMLGYVETWSATRRARKAGDSAMVDAFAAALTERWTDSQIRIAWPITIRAARL